MTKKLTVAQALILFLKNQYVVRDGIENPFFAGCFGIFGHGNVVGLGEALKKIRILNIIKPEMSKQWFMQPQHFQK